MSPEPSRNISRPLRNRPQRTENLPFKTRSMRKVAANIEVNTARRFASIRRGFGFVSTAADRFGSLAGRRTRASVLSMPELAPAFQQTYSILPFTFVLLSLPLHAMNKTRLLG